MKILRIKGGLGNQIFQCLYLLTNSSDNELLIVDQSIFRRKFEMDYAGSEFRLLELLSSEVKKRIIFVDVWYPLSALFWKIAGKLKFKKILMIDDYCSKASNFNRNIQYYNFFNLHTNQFRNEINDYSILIHVRKGDYLNNTNEKIYFNCDIEYFKNAITEIEKKVSVPKYYIVSNDKNWVEKNFNFLENYTYIDVVDPIESFKIMCLFKNFIISNSTFSWWPAFMSSSATVVAPKKWFLDEKMNIDLYPEEWIKI